MVLGKMHVANFAIFGERFACHQHCLKQECAIENIDSAGEVISVLLSIAVALDWVIVNTCCTDNQPKVVRLPETWSVVCHIAHSMGHGVVSGPA